MSDRPADSSPAAPPGSEAPPEVRRPVRMPGREALGREALGREALGRSGDESVRDESVRDGVHGDGVHGDGARLPVVPQTASATVHASADEGASLTVERVLRFVLGLAGLAAAGYVLWTFAGLVIYLVVGGIFAYLIAPLVDRIQGFGLGRTPSIFVTFVLVVGALLVGVTSVVPFLAEQGHELMRIVSVDAAVEVANQVEDRLQRIVPFEEGLVVEGVREAARALVAGELTEGEYFAETMTSVWSVFTNILYAAIVIPFITFFLLKDGLLIRRNVLRLVPNRYFEVTLALVEKVETSLGRYFRALLTQCVSVAVIAATTLWAAGLDNALAIGIFTGLANTIPYFGPFIGFVTGTLVGIAQTGDFSLVFGVAVAMGVTQMADNVLLQPLIFSRAAQAHPLVILLVVLAGAQLAGIVGMLVAIPLTTVARVVVEQVIWSVRNYRILRAGTRGA